MCKDFTFNFEREEIEKKCEAYATLNEQIRYLECVLKEYKTNPPDLNVNYGISPTFEEWIEGQLRWLSYLINEPESKVEGFVKIIGKMSDIVRIFEAMKNKEIISTVTEAAQIGRIFFRDNTEIKKFASNYAARKKDTIKEGRTTVSEPLVEFVKELIQISFKGRNDELDSLRNFLDKMK